MESPRADEGTISAVVNAIEYVTYPMPESEELLKEARRKKEELSGMNHDD